MGRAHDERPPAGGRLRQGAALVRGLAALPHCLRRWPCRTSKNPPNRSGCMSKR
jgi:hypothetical protein